MKKIFFAMLCIMFFFSGCTGKDSLNPGNIAETSNINTLRNGDFFSVTGVVDFSDDPSDIGQEYCLITGNEKIQYYYTDIYNNESKWASDVFYTKGNDTPLLKEYVGEKVTVSGVFDAECHGIPYITNISIVYN